MIRTCKNLLLITIFYLFSFVSIAQQNRIVDSLLNILKTAKEDTVQINALDNLGWEVKYNNPDTAIILGMKALKITENIALPLEKKEILIANISKNLGVYNHLKGNYPEALLLYFKALKIYEKRNNKSGVAAALTNIGSVYFNQSDYQKALEHYLEALKITEEITHSQNKALAKKGKDKLSGLFGNIGSVYSDLGNYSKSLEYYFKALNISEDKADKDGVSRWLGNIANVYQEKADSAYAKENYKTPLGGLYQKSLTYYLKALKIAEELGNKNAIAIKLGNIGTLNAKIAKNEPTLKQRIAKYKEAEDYLMKALALSNTIGALNYAKNFEEALSKLYSATGKHELALQHYKKFINARDSLSNDENKKKSLIAELNFNFEKKEALSKAAAVAAAGIAAEETKKHKIIIYSILCGLLLVVIFAVFVFRAFRHKMKANIIITKQKLEVEKQKTIVDEKQKEILDSIHYAKRIQTALLTSEKYINRNLNNLMK